MEDRVGGGGRIRRQLMMLIRGGPLRKGVGGRG